MATDKGLLCVRVTDQKRPSFSSYCYHVNGNETVCYNERAMLLLSDGRLLIGTTKGYQIVSLSRLLSNEQKRTDKNPLLLATLRVNGRYVTPGDSAGIKVPTSLTHLSELELNYNQNNLMVECLPRDYTNDINATYRYMLKGLSDQWLPMDNYQVVLSNLPSGRYELMVRCYDDAAVNDQFGEWQMLSVVIHPALLAHVVGLPCLFGTHQFGFMGKSELLS